LDGLKLIFALEIYATIDLLLHVFLVPLVILLIH